MTRTCIITGRKGQSGNTVSHANNRTKRKFLPNLQNASLMSETLGATVSMRISPRGVRTVEKNGGLDAYLLGKSNSRLTEEARKLKRRIVRAAAKKAKVA